MRFFNLAAAAFTATLVIASPLAAQNEVRLSFAGTVRLDQPEPLVASEGTPVTSPVPEAGVTVTFHGHEAGIHEYTTERRARAMTDENGNFYVEVKMSEYRYSWTHVTIAVDSTDISKGATITSEIYNDGQGGCSGIKDVQVMPL